MRNETANRYDFPKVGISGSRMHLIIGINKIQPTGRVARPFWDV